MYTNTHILFYFACFSVLVNALYVSSLDTTALILGCGATADGNDTDGRTWQPDSKYLVSGGSSEGRAQFQDPSLLSEIPYMTARIFTSEATYQFPVKADKRYWLRLHFYPSTYNNQNSNDAYFSVVAGGVTLLKNFSAAITAQALTQSYLVREYSLAPSGSNTLTVIFKPSDKYNGAFAFINGMELIQIPDLFDTATLVGFSDQSIDAKSSSLQTMYRLNVGGQYIAPSLDSGGLTRTWYDDWPYVFGAATGITSEASKNVKIQYQAMPDYVAPVDVYKTSRSMGPNKNLNMNYNLTWTFQVDGNFTYLVRLHFCDYVMTKINQRVFDIFINNQTAQPQADVIGWSGGKAVAMYKDYAIYVSDRVGDEELLLQMHPSAETKPEYYEALLNGLEIFKINDQKGNLAGPNPQPSEMLLKAQEEAMVQADKDFEDTSKTKVIGGAAGGAAAAGIVAALCIAVYQRKKRVPGTESHTSSWLPIYGNSHTTGSKSHSGKSSSSHLSTLHQGLCRHFSLPEIKQATKNFDESNVIGVGGFGKVYKGVIDGTMKVAVKRSNPSSEQGVNEFQTEIEMLSKLRHKHLVSLIGCCEEDEEMCLVYDYMARGTLREHLYKANKPPLSWKQRLEICIGAARGLHYLDPEYFRRQQLTEKSDVYSFGVVLFEVLCARPALNPSLSKEQVSLADWVLHCSRKGTLEDIIDPHLKGKIKPECLKKFTDTAEKCLADHGLERPSMGDILWNLEFALQAQENPDSTKRTAESDSYEEETVNPQMGLHANNPSIGSEHELGGESEDLNTNDIFSQIVNPKGR